MTLAELITRAIDTAISGSDVDSNIIRKQTLEAEVLTDLAFHDLAEEIADDPDLRGRLEAQFSVTLVNGVGTIPAGLMIEYLREGSVRDADSSANAGFGNILQRIKYYNDFLGYTLPVYGYYCIVDNQIFTKQINTGDFTATLTPLTIDAPFVPSKANLNTQVPDEIQDDLVEILAIKLRGMIDKQMQAA